MDSNMPKPKTNEEKLELINANRNLIPANQVESFNALDIDGQYKRMQRYLRKSTKTIVTKSTSKLNVKKVVKDIVSKNPTQKQINYIVDQLTEWSTNAKQRKIDEIDKQIAQLTAQKNNLL